MEVANILAYYDTATITAVKSFIVLAPGHLIQTLNLRMMRQVLYLLCCGPSHSTYLEIVIRNG